jgi:hypothetical protein
MAKSGPKQQLQKNQARLKFLRSLLAVTNVVFALGRLVYHRASNTAMLYATGLGMAGLQYFCFKAVSRMAEPLLGANGEVLDGGADVSTASIASYYQDVIYLCAFVQVLSVFTDKAFWAFWLLPLVAGWIVFQTFIRPMMAAHGATSKSVPETEGDKRKREKAERKAGRPKMKTMH